MVAHLRRYFPLDCEALGEERVRAEVRYGVSRAKAYGLLKEPGVCIFIDVMFAYGYDFDLRRSLPWAAQILRSKTIVDERLRAQRLLRAAEANLPKAPPMNVKWGPGAS